METENPTSFPSRIQTLSLAAILCAAPIAAAQSESAASIAASEQLSRFTAVEEANELLRKGDEAYQAGRFADAVEAYAGARELLPDAPVTTELRQAATERYAQASVEQARVLSRKGDVPAAKAAVDKVLRPDVAPNDPVALAFRARLDDPIRTNPALTAEHARNIDAVRRHLYTAEGAYNLGKFDQARDEYHNALKIDSTNTAARRGLERVAAARSDSSRAAFDQTRAEMLSQVGAAWETAVPSIDLGLDFDDPGLTSGPGGITVAAKLDQIIIPRVQLDQANLDEALELLRIRAAEHDRLESDPARKGVNFAVNIGQQNSDTATRIRSIRFDLQLTNVPLSRILDYVTDMTETDFTTDEFSVIIKPRGSSSAELINRVYKVPVDFLGNLGGEDNAAANDDPFAPTPAGGGLLTRRLSAQEALEKQGINFPEGALANYSATTNTLRIINTEANHSMITQLIDSMLRTEPVVVSIKVTMIKIQQSDLEELSYDWLVNPFAANSGDTLFGGGGTIGNSAGRTAADMTGPFPGLPADPNALVTDGLVTNGLRSGDNGISSNAIDQMISNPDRGAQTSAVAPGILSVTGLFTDGEVQMMLRGLSQKKSTDMVARPAVHTRSGQASRISVTTDFFFPTEYEPPELPNSVGIGGSAPVTPATPTAFDKREIGVVLEVLPVADPNKRYVDITLNPSFSDFDGFVNYGTPIRTTSSGLQGTQVLELTPNRILQPVFSVQRTSTQLSVADGATVALGGMMSQSIQTVEDSVPILGDLPLVGRFFKSSARKPVSAAVIFLVHVELLDPTGRPYRDR
jgi:general secretion pathway protein D